MKFSLPHRLLATLLFLCALFVCAPARAQTLVTLQGAESTIEPGAWGREPPSQTWSFARPRVGAGRRVALSFEGFLETPQSGSQFWMRILVNGQPVEAQPTRLATRLLNKSIYVDPNNPEPGYRWGRNQAWRLQFDRGFANATPDWYRLEIDVTDLLRDGDNTVSMGREPIANIYMPCHVRDVRLVDVAGAGPASGFGIGGAPAAPAQSARADGGLSFAIGAQTLPVTSWFSVPGGGWRRLGPPSGALRAGEIAAPVTRAGEGATRTVVMDLPDYQLTRTVTQGADGRTRIVDSVRNKTAADIGLMADHAVSAPAAIGRAQLGGYWDAGQSEVCAPGRPTVFLPLGAANLALVADDDVFRNQALEYYRADGRAVGLKTERRIVPARATITLEWSVYAFAGDDEFDMVNAVRKNWEVYAGPVPGPIWTTQIETLEGSSDAQLRDFAARSGLWAMHYASNWRGDAATAPDDIGFGTGPLDPAFADLRARIKASADRVHRAMPGVKYGIYDHFWLQSPDTAAYADARALNQNGAPRLYSDEVTPVMLPAKDPVSATFSNPTSFGADFVKMLNGQVETLGADSFFFDESQGSIWHDRYCYGQFSYDVPDGASAILDPTTFAIQRRIGILPLLVRQWTKQTYADLNAAGLSVVSNGTASTRLENQNSNPRLIESNLNQYDANRVHFGTPIAWIYPGVYDVAMLRYYLNMGTLVANTTPDDKLNITKHFFPISVTQLRSGTVFGQQRIVTMHSGEYGWPGTADALLWRWNADGTPADAAPLRRTVTGATSIEVPAGGLIVLERAAPASGKS